VVSQYKELISELSQTYPGRASASPIMDLFISMLEVGLKGYKDLLKERKQNFSLLHSEISKWAQANNETVIINSRNQISLAVTLNQIGPEKAKELGAYLYRKGVMGARVVVQSELKENNEDNQNQCKSSVWTNTKIFTKKLVFKNFGGHTENEKWEGFPYLTLAAAIGLKEKEINELLKRLDSVYSKMMKK
jgi:O-phospho-L-seryl-tRNASec:L-selenocysteinyl-tRNA synthase